MHNQFRLLFAFVTLFELVGVLRERVRILKYFMYYRKHRNNYQFPDKDESQIKYQINVVFILQNHDKLVKKNQYQINIILPLQKPYPFTISIWYGANMHIPDKIPNSRKCENPMLIWYLFNKCGWLGRAGKGLLQLQAWVSTKWSPINSFFSSQILIFYQYSVSKTHFYHTILQDSIHRHPGLEL